MMPRSIRNVILSMTCFALTLLATAGAHADSVFVFHTDTSIISGLRGYIDLQYNGLLGAGESTATITLFSTDGSLGGPTPIHTIGDVTGDLASTIVIENGALNNSGLNDYDEAITFGTFTAFMVTLSGPAGGTANSGFALIYYNSDYSVSLLSSDISGASAALTVEPNGTVVTETYADAGGKYYTTVTNESEPSPVPEPSSFFAVGAGLALLAGYAARHRFSCLAQSR
jgi:hypothetical protein